MCVCCPVVPNQEIPQDPSRPIKTHQDPISWTANIFPMWSLWSGHVGMSSLASACWPSWLSPGRANAAGLAPASTVIREVSRNECVDLDSEKEGPIQSTHPKLLCLIIPPEIRGYQMLLIVAHSSHSNLGISTAEHPATLAPAATFVASPQAPPNATGACAWTHRPGQE